MSDEDFESDSEDDFSASEDDWEPHKKPKSGDDSESDGSNESTHRSIFSPKRTKKSHKRSLQGKKTNASLIKRGHATSSLRTQLLKRQSKTSLSNTSSPRNVSKAATDSSESSGDEYLVNPDELDLKSSFFDVRPSTSGLTSNQSPVFDCNAGMHLSDSEKEDIEANDVNDPDIKLKGSPTTLTVSSKINESSAERINLQHLHDYALKMENAREKLLNHSDSMQPSNEGKIDVSSLLAMGEMNSDQMSSIKTNNNPNIKVKRKKKNDSDTDWEEVEDEKLDATKDVQFTVVQEQQTRKKDKSTLDAEAVLKRKLNRMIKDNQLNLHKVSLICHLSNGFYCNNIINNPSLMASALKLLPNNSCYPKGRTEINYFESIIKWYKTAIKLEYSGMYPNIKKRPPLITSLALQIQYKHAICKRDYVLIFITILRAMGIHVRLVINLIPSQMRPSQNDLCKIKLKPEEDKSKKDLKAVPQKDSAKKPKSEPSNKSQEIKIKEKKISEDKKQIKKSTKNEEITIDTVSTERPKRVTRARNANKNESLENSNKTKKSLEVKPKVSKAEKGVPANQVVDSKVVADESSSKTKRKVLQASKDKKELVPNPSILVTDTSKPSKILTRNRNKNPVPVDNITSETKTISEETDKSKISTNGPAKRTRQKSRSPSPKVFISTKFLKKDKNVEVDSANSNSLKKPLSKKIKISQLTIPQLDGADDIPRKRKPNLKKLSVSISKKKEISDSEEEFEPTPSKKPKPKMLTKKTEKDRHVLSSSDNEESSKLTNKNATDAWVEVFSETEDQWISIDLFKGKIHCVDNIRRSSSGGHMAYVFAWNNDNSIKDVTARYCTQWNTVVRKHRVEQRWLDEMLRQYYGRKNARDKAEDRELKKIHLDKPLPTTISEYKNNPLYALERHLLKFEAIYPANALTLGFVRGEPVYARECVHTLHSREIWLKSARVVKPGEKPYKIVKARPKWDRMTSTVIKDKPLEIFGYWQTMEYDPPTAENGIVPRNAYGNVELFKMSMLPKKTVHLQLAGLNRVCKKLRIDCAPAVVGFDFHQGSCHPTYDGFVVCEEFEKQVVDAWHQDQEDQERKEEEKYLSRVYGNWKKLYRALLIRERLKIKYNFKGVTYEPPAKKTRNTKRN